MERNFKQGCAEFLSYTPELVYSFLNTPYMRNFDYQRKRWYYRHKVEMLGSAGFDVSNAYRTKLTGFEDLWKFFDMSNIYENLWIKHRHPLKHFFPNAPFRNAMEYNGGHVISPKIPLIKSYEDGFSWNYLQKESIGDFH